MTKTEKITVVGTIRLGAFLKLANVVDNGAESKEIIQDGDVYVNDQVETRRGRQLKNGDVITVKTYNQVLEFEVEEVEQ